jgi:hypothetical protein
MMNIDLPCEDIALTEIDVKSCIRWKRRFTVNPHETVTVSFAPFAVAGVGDFEEIVGIWRYPDTPELKKRELISTRERAAMIARASWEHFTTMNTIRALTIEARQRFQVSGQAWPRPLGDQTP